MAATHDLYRNYSGSDATVVTLFSNTLPVITAIDDEEMGETYDWSRSGYTFLGWNTARNGSGTMLQPGATAVNSTYYAQWQEAASTSVSVQLGNTEIATLSSSGSVVLATAGTYLTSDITVTLTT